MDREADILKDRIEILTLERHRKDAREGIGGQKDEGEKGRQNPGLHRKDIGLQARGQIAPKGCDQRAEKGENQHPEQHRAFVIAPDARDLEDHGFERMGVLEDVEDGEVGCDIGGGERREGEGEQEKARARRHRPDIHQALVPDPRPNQRRDRLNQTYG